MKKFEVDGREILLSRVGGSYYDTLHDEWILYGE